MIATLARKKENKSQKIVTALTSVFFKIKIKIYWRNFAKRRNSIKN